MRTNIQAEPQNGHLQTNGVLPQSEVAAPEAHPQIHPLAGVIGGFADDPLWEEFVEQMKQERRDLAQSEEKTE